MFSRSALGGSFVIFTPLCSTDTGKDGEGYDVSHRRKLACSGAPLPPPPPPLLPGAPAAAASAASCSQMVSRRVIHDTARWQFWSTTRRALSIMPSAMGPCPCPSEMAYTLNPCVSAKYMSAAMGSDPGDSTNTSGWPGDESS